MNGMAVLVTAVILVGFICLADLLLTFGVIRRLRQHAEQIDSFGQAGLTAPPVVGLAAGEAPAAFASVTLDGEPITGPAEIRMAAFFSTTCSACPGQVAPFLDYVRSHQLPKDSMLAVVIGSPAEPPAYLDDLRQVAQIVFEDVEGAICQAFGVSGFPAFCVLDSDWAVVASGFDPARLPAPAAVR
jgi:hypothetical protein